MDVQMRGPYWRSTSGSDLDDEVAMRSDWSHRFRSSADKRRGFV